MFITYGFQFLDKAILGYAAVYSLMADNVTILSGVFDVIY
jgi:hypothetical protein